MKEGRRAAPLLDLMGNSSKKEFAAQFCGNPSVYEAWGVQMEDYLMEPFMQKYKQRKVKVENQDWKTLEFLQSKECPNGYKYVKAGHSLGAAISQLLTYCNNYFYYGLWQEAFSAGRDWPEWVKDYLFFSEIYQFGTVPTSNAGNLIDYGKLVVRNSFQGNLSEFLSTSAHSISAPALTTPPTQMFFPKSLWPDLCGRGARIYFGSNKLYDPAISSACHQAFDPLPSVRLQDQLSGTIRYSCTCPSLFYPGTPRGWIEALIKEKSPCAFYESHSHICNPCKDADADPNYQAHSNVGAYICGVRHAFETFTEEQSKECNEMYQKLQSEIAAEKQCEVAPDNAQPVQDPFVLPVDPLGWHGFKS